MLSPRTPLDLRSAFPDGYRALSAIEAALRAGPLPTATKELVKIRASQLNGCAFCVDMHYKDARFAGESEERLSLVAVWREATCFTPAERAALALTEALTLVSRGPVPEEVEDEARRHFDDASYAALVYAIVVINAWNRVSIAGHAVPGLYRPGGAR